MTGDGLMAGWTPVPEHRGCPGWGAPPGSWSAIGHALDQGGYTLAGLWADAGVVQVALYDPGARALHVVSRPTDGMPVPALSASHLPALRLERAVRDLHGIRFEGLPDDRPWLDHGCWPVRAPLGAHTPASPVAAAYPFLPAEGPGLHQVPVGPIHAGTIEPGHFRFTAHGETVVRLEQRLGYAHKGIEALMAGRSAAEAAPLAARLSGDSTVASGWAFARAVELALELIVPARAVWLRAIMAELERLANHLGDVGAICNDAAFSLLFAEFGVLREDVLRASAAAFGHRLMMDRVVPGGTSVDLPAAGAKVIPDLLRRIRRRLPQLIEVYENTASLQDRTVGAGRVPRELALQYGAGGFVGRASGRPFDARACLPYAPYDHFGLVPVVREQGDVDARVWVRLGEIDQSLGLLERLLDGLPSGPVLVPPGAAAAGGGTEATTMIEGFRGDILAHVRLDRSGRIARCHLRDPSWFQWPLLEAAVRDNIVADFPLCNKSFNCAYSGHDL